MAKFTTTTVVHGEHGSVWFNAGEPVPDWVAEISESLNPDIFDTPPEKAEVEEKSEKTGSKKSKK